MPVLRVRAHPRGLSIAQLRKVYCLRKESLSWEKIAKRVWNLQHQRPGWKVCCCVVPEQCSRISGMSRACRTMFRTCFSQC